MLIRAAQHTLDNVLWSSQPRVSAHSHRQTVRAQAPLAESASEDASATPRPRELDFGGEASVELFHAGVKGEAKVMFDPLVGLVRALPAPAVTRQS